MPWYGWVSVGVIVSLLAAILAGLVKIAHLLDDHEYQARWEKE